MTHTPNDDSKQRSASAASYLQHSQLAAVVETAVVVRPPRNITDLVSYRSACKGVNMHWVTGMPPSFSLHAETTS